MDPSAMPASQYLHYRIRPWQPPDRQAAAGVIASVLAEYGLDWQPEEADMDVLAIEAHYHNQGGEFWVVETEGRLVGTAGYYPVARGEAAVEVRKMYLLPEARGQGLGRYLLQQLEQRISERGFQQVWVETATVLDRAVRLYETSGYEPTEGVETCRCDRIYRKYLWGR